MKEKESYPYNWENISQTKFKNEWKIPTRKDMKEIKKFIKEIKKPLKDE